MGSLQPVLLLYLRGRPLRDNSPRVPSRWPRTPPSPLQAVRPRLLPSALRPWGSYRQGQLLIHHQYVIAWQHRLPRWGHRVPRRPDLELPQWSFGGYLGLTNVTDKQPHNFMYHVLGLYFSHKIAFLRRQTCWGCVGCSKPESRFIKTSSTSSPFKNALCTCSCLMF